MKPTISKPFKSNDRTFDKVYNAFDKRDYFNSQGLAKVQIGNFERALKKNDKGAQQVLDLFKGDEKKAKDYIIQVISDRNKERAFNNYKAMKDAVDSIQKGKPNVGSVDYVKRIIHNSSQKYSIALYSALRNKKFTKWKDVHDDIDSLIGESVNEGKKRYYQQDRVGSAKYTISYHDGKKKHKDGSDFFDIQTFKNKKDLAKFVNTLHKGGYVYGFNESVNEGISVFDERHFGKKGIIIMIDDNGKKVSAIFKDKKNADKFNRNNPSDIKKLLQLAKKTKFPKAIDESEDGVPQGYNPMVEDKNQIIQINKKSNKNETKFYDILSTIEKKLGKRKYRLWLEKSLKDFGENPKHYDYRTNASIEEKLFQVSK